MRRIPGVAALLVTLTTAAYAGDEVRTVTGLTRGQFDSNCAAMEGSSSSNYGGRVCELPSGTTVTCAFNSSPQTDCLVQTRDRKGKKGKKDQVDYLIVELKDLLVSGVRSDDPDGDKGEIASTGGSLGGGESVDPSPGGDGKSDSADGAAAGGNPDSIGGGPGPGAD